MNQIRKLVFSIIGSKCVHVEIVVLLDIKRRRL